MQRKEIAGMGTSKVVTGAIIILLALGATVFYLFYTGRFGGGSKIRITDPTRVGYEWNHLAADNNIVSDYLFSRSKKLIVAKGGNGVLAATSYTIPGRLVTQEEENSGIYSLSDQALLLKCYVRAGDRGSAVALKETVIRDFKLENGSYRSFVYSGEKENEDVVTTAASLDWLDAMMEYYVTYGNDNDYNEIKGLTEVLFDSEGRIKTEPISVAAYVESLYVSLDDTSSIKEGDEGSMEQIYGTLTGDYDSAEVDDKTVLEDVSGVLLSNINLRLIRDLENNGLIAAGAYDRALKAVKDGFTGEGYNFYAYSTAGDMDCGEYVYSGTNIGSFDLAQNIKTMRNLAEVGELDGESFATFKEMIFNFGKIYSAYTIMTGNYSGGEAYSSYTDGMMIAYYMGDKDIYEKLSDTLGKRVATKSTSPALYMIFREENERYVFYARENFSTRLVTS